MSCLDRAQPPEVALPSIQRQQTMSVSKALVLLLTLVSQRAGVAADCRLHTANCSQCLQHADSGTHFNK